MGYNAHFRVWRGDAGDGGLEDYQVEVNEGEVVLDIIHRIQATQAPDLAVRWNCKAGKCGSCSAEINGRPRLLCMTRMSTFGENEPIVVTPLRTFPSIRDLVTDVSFNYVKARELPAFAPPAGVAPGDYRMQQVDVERSQEFRKCIECFLCQNTCHVIRDHEENKPAFAGPRLFIRLAELDMHPLDSLDRKRQAQDVHGLGYCNITKCCSEVCPEHIKITDNGIIPLKERVADVKYDPVRFLGSKIGRRDGVAKGVDAASAPAVEQAARERLAASKDDRKALTSLHSALVAQGRFAEAVPYARRLAESAGRGRSGQRDAHHAHARTLLLAVEAGQVAPERARPHIEGALEIAQRHAGTGTLLAGTHALNELLYGDPAAAEKEATDSLGWHRSRREKADDQLTLAKALEAQGRSEEAAAAHAAARQLWPSNPRLQRTNAPADAAATAAR
jgi:succinate dehydrogenase / fumarate reductase iron-sulfur subunit